MQRAPGRNAWGFVLLHKVIHKYISLQEIGIHLGIQIKKQQ
jgi:hypothetical protein